MAADHETSDSATATGDAPGGGSVGGGGADIPLGQRLFDRPFLLLAFGLAVMVVFFTLWGLWEINSLPQAPLP